MYAGVVLLSLLAQDVEQWRVEREVKLKADDGWLTVAGLHWLEEGSNAVPAAPGVFERKGAEVRFRATQLGTLRNGLAVPPGLPVVMRSDAGGATPDLLVYRDLTMFVIARGDRLGVRVRDKNSPMRREFTGLHWFPVKPEYRVEAKWVAYEQPKTIAVPNVLDQVEQQKSIGYASFQIHGKEYTLEPVVEGEELFYIFKDLTAGKETYPAGRFLYSAMPADGKVILDFNKAYNPPCAFTPYATCPLPPKQNRLQVRIEAGELTYGHH